MPMTAQHEPQEPRESTPGKFQGEPPYVRAFWEEALRGFADHDIVDGDTLISAFIIDEDDVKRWPVLADTYAVAVWEREDGFVCLIRFDEEGFGAWCEACESDGDGEDDGE
jgi:hypothetical protein